MASMPVMTKASTDNCMMTSKISDISPPEKSQGNLWIAHNLSDCQRADR
jgi:hypothetical protein